MGSPPGNPVGPWTLYRYFAGDGDLLYVGISRAFEKRNQAHRYHSAWYEFSRILVRQTFADKRQALTAEKEAIVTEQPRFNVEWNLSKPGGRIGERWLLYPEAPAHRLSEVVPCTDFVIELGFDAKLAKTLLRNANGPPPYQHNGQAVYLRSEGYTWLASCARGRR